MISKSVEQKQWWPVWLARNGPYQSHVFLADDLLLLGEASFSQARLMEHILGVFCGNFGERMNMNKSRIWFSPDTPNYLRNSIYAEFKITPTLDLGVYLSVPLVHGRVWKRHYQYLIERTEKRLAGWKIKFLSKAARTVLLSSTLCLPVYAMQTTVVPKMVVGQLERLCR